MAWAVKQRLPVKQKIVLLMLADRVNKDTGRCDPSIARLADDCGMSSTSVKEAIRTLKEAGLIVAHERRLGDVNLPNLYELKVDEFPGVGRVTPGGGACDAGGVGRVTPPNLEDQPVTKPDITADAGFFDRIEDAEKQETDHFTEFWSAYPDGRKVGPTKTKQLFQQITSGKHKSLPKVSPDSLISAAARFAASSPDPQYVPLPTSWLNGERWLQWPEPERNQKPEPWRGEVVR